MTAQTKWNDLRDKLRLEAEMLRAGRARNGFLSRIERLEMAIALETRVVVYSKRKVT